MHKIAVLTSSDSWFVPYAKAFVERLNKKGHKKNAKLFYDHKAIPAAYEIVFVLSYGQIIAKSFLVKHKHNIVVHASALPKGAGWAPMFWQILEGKNKIPFTLFEAAENADSGAIYLTSVLSLRGDELHDELRQLEASKVIEMCDLFLSRIDHLKPIFQKGKRTFYRRRSPQDSELDVRKSLQELFPLLRTVSNKDFPAFFRYRGRKYILQIHDGGADLHG